MRPSIYRGATVINKNLQERDLFCWKKTTKLCFSLFVFFPVMDCEVSDWSDWSECDVSCGIGTSVRSRSILRPESNGGAECPVLEEKKTCKASRCSKRRLDQISALRGKHFFKHLFNSELVYTSITRIFLPKNPPRSLTELESLASFWAYLSFLKPSTSEHSSSPSWAIFHQIIIISLLLKQIFQKRLYQHHARARGFQKA